ncbi:alpha-E domain-containing protein [Vibrio viridaestus]|uniref:Alpha-E domain-containing protein n=1 Tax=Vibrio viridaestus TaxID=2487322 RepID=A0A3N9TJE7_9VIBR|nr:alpha-E domain-containing protein [Vibrio viridaestus]RQW63685.1 alpha-E domain-containing protein [Vibrio viridaestus]
MLSRVAERLYWSARYLERIENTARLLSVYDDLLFDLPRNVRISWYNLIEINGSVALFGRLYQDKKEKSVVKFLLADLDNPSSMLSSLKMVRENIRTTRDVVPGKTWELVNELDLYVKRHIQKGIDRSERHEFLSTVIEGCQKIVGLLTGAMSRDDAWNFIIIGRHIERADMNTRIVDSAVTLILQSETEERIKLSQVIWSKVLKSQSAYLNYRRTVRSAISGAKAVTFLLTDPYFPRSQYYSLQEIKSAAANLPRYEGLASQIDDLLDNTHGIERSEDLDHQFSVYLNDVQLAIIALNQKIGQNWFHFEHDQNQTQTQGELA